MEIGRFKSSIGGQISGRNLIAEEHQFLMMECKQKYNEKFNCIIQKFPLAKIKFKPVMSTIAGVVSIVVELPTHEQQTQFNVWFRENDK